MIERDSMLEFIRRRPLEVAASSLAIVAAVAVFSKLSELDALVDDRAKPASPSLVNLHKKDLPSNSRATQFKAVESEVEESIANSNLQISSPLEYCEATKMSLILSGKNLQQAVGRLNQVREDLQKSDPQNMDRFFSDKNFYLSCRPGDTDHNYSVNGLPSSTDPRTEPFLCVSQAIKDMKKSLLVVAGFSDESMSPLEKRAFYKEISSLAAEFANELNRATFSLLDPNELVSDYNSTLNFLNIALSEQGSQHFDCALLAKFLMLNAQLESFQSYEVALPENLAAMREHLKSGKLVDDLNLSTEARERVVDFQLQCQQNNYAAGLLKQ